MPAMSSFHSTPRAAELNVWIMLSPTFAHFINNKFIGSRSGRQFEKRSPVDGSLIGMVPEAGDSEGDAAVRAGPAALLGPWRRLPLSQPAGVPGAVPARVD